MFGICFLVLFCLNYVNAQYNYYNGPNPLAFVGYWPFDIDPQCQPGDPEMAYCYGDIEFFNFWLVIGSWRSRAAAVAYSNPGPFKQNGTAMYSIDASKFIQMSQTYLDPKTGFTVAFYYYHEKTTAAEVDVLFRNGAGVNEWRQLRVEYAHPEMSATVTIAGGKEFKQVIAKDIHPPKTWQFYVITWDGRQKITVYNRISGIFIGSFNLPPTESDIATTMIDPQFVFGKFPKNNSLIANLVLFDSSLTQGDIARLPCVALTRGQCNETYAFGKRPVIHPKVADPVAFFTLDPNSLLAEVVTGLSPNSSNVKLSSVGALTTKENDKFLAGFYMPNLKFADDVTISFYLNCKSLSSPTTLLSIDHKFHISLTSCNKVNYAKDGAKSDLDLSVSDSDKDNSWKFVWVVAPGVQMASGDISIGPDKADTSIGMICLSIFKGSLSKENALLMECYCPGYGRVLPSFIADQCINRGAQPNRLAPSATMSKAALFVPFDSYTFFENVVTFQVDQKIRSGRSAVIAYYGPYNMSGSSYLSNSEMDTFAIYDDIPAVTANFAFTFTFHISLGDDVGPQTYRTIFTWYNTTGEKLTQFGIEEGRTSLYVRTIGPLINTTFDLKPNEWYLVIVTYTPGSQPVIEILPEGKTEEKMKQSKYKRPTPLVGNNPKAEKDKLGSSRVTIGPLYPNDRIACLMLFTVNLTPEQTNDIPYICMSKGYLYQK